MYEPMSLEGLDTQSEDVLKAIEDHVTDIALGPALTLSTHSSSIKVRFDVLGKTDAEIYNRVAKVIDAIVRHTGLELRVNSSSVEAHQGVEHKVVGKVAVG